MKHLFPDKESDAAKLAAWLEQGKVRKHAAADAWALADDASNTAPQDWLARFSVVGIYLGALSFAVGVIFFFAYNWDYLHRFIKFALIESALLLILAGLYRFGKRDWPWGIPAALMLLDLLVGALLALSGQVYQTGADPWQLFAIWSAFSLFPAFAYRNDLLWCAAILQANLALWLHFQALGRFFVFDWSADTMLLVAAIANLLLHLLVNQRQRLANRQVKLLLADGLLLTLGVGQLALYAGMKVMGDVLDPEHSIHGVAGVTSGLVILFFPVFLYYRRLQIYVLGLGMWGFGAIAVFSCVLGRLLFEIDDPVGGFLLVGLFIVGSSSALTVYLRRLINTGQGELVTRLQESKR
ncbi:DUF2157 domain-containing protein [Shewanella sp.]|uniref:DUF2157 domain-containing protein n=1 Tax=Shewanella sp. TaxID=50422 RepID=UPI003563E299